MSTVKTAKGTELHLITLKGKQYLPVAQRVIWFREERPGWGIQTTFLPLTEKLAVAQATISNEAGMIMAMGTKSETPQGFPDFIEKAESGSIGRALALCGFGTQFTDDLDEGTERIVDTPQSSNRQAPRAQPMVNHAPQASGESSGGYVIQMGKFKGLALKDVSGPDLDNYINWLKSDAEKKGKPINGPALDLCQNGEAYLRSIEFKRDR